MSWVAATCQECKTPRQLGFAAAVTDGYHVTHMPDETTWLTWRCPQCGWQATQIPPSWLHKHTTTLRRVGMPTVDLSDIDPHAERDTMAVNQYAHAQLAHIASCPRLTAAAINDTIHRALTLGGTT